MELLKPAGTWNPRNYQFSTFVEGIGLTAIGVQIKVFGKQNFRISSMPHMAGGPTDVRRTKLSTLPYRRVWYHF